MTTVLLAPDRYLTASATVEAALAGQVFFRLAADLDGFQFAKAITPECARLLAHALTCAADRCDARSTTLATDL